MSGQALDQVAALLLGALSSGIAVGVLLGLWLTH